MKKEFKLCLSPETIQLAQKVGLELTFKTECKTELDLPDNAVPDNIGIYIGKGTKKDMVSFLKDDTECKLLLDYIKHGIVKTKYFTQYVGDKLCDVPHYFMIYEVEESLKKRPTYTECSCGNGTPISGYYVCEYEILLGEGDYTRRMVFSTESVNISMYEWLEDLEEKLEYLESEEETIKSQFYSDGDEWMYTMFDSIGHPVETELNVSEFLSMIVGIRQLSCKYVEEKE